MITDPEFVDTTHDETRPPSEDEGRANVQAESGSQSPPKSEQGHSRKS